MLIYGYQYSSKLVKYFLNKHKYNLSISKQATMCELSSLDGVSNLYISTTPNMCGTLYIYQLDMLNKQTLLLLDDLVNLLGYSCVRCDFSRNQNSQDTKNLLIDNGFIVTSTWKNHRSTNLIDTMEKHYDIEEKELLYEGRFVTRLLKIMERNNAI